MDGNLCIIAVYDYKKPGNMGLGYSAFGGQEWIRKLKPRRFFERRIVPFGEDGILVPKTDDHFIFQKNNHDSPSPTVRETLKILPFTLLFAAVLAIGAAIFYWAIQ